MKKSSSPGSLLSVDIRRMLSQKLFYIMLAASALIPVLIFVMTRFSSGSAEEGAVMFTSVWQAVGSAGSAMSMDLTSMCNINLIYFLAAVFACIFTADDFKSGYCKNIFSVREKKAGYVFSKITVSFITGALMLIAYFAGSMAGGKIAGLSFSMDGFNAWNVFMCMLSKVFLMAIFAAIYVMMSVIAKKRSWMSILLSFTVGMFMFMVIPMMTPLTSGIMNALMCLAGGLIFSVALGKLGSFVLAKTDII